MKKIVGALVISLIIPAFAGAAIQDIQVSNNTSAAVTISWITDSDSKGEVHYSKNDDLSNHSTGYDIRGQVFEGCTHYINITNLTKETIYYFEVVSGGEIDNNNGNYYIFKTMKEPSTPPGICLIYSHVSQEDGSTAAEDAIVYLWITHDGVDSYLLSKLIPSNGSFLINIKEARSVNTDNLFSSIDPGDPIRLKAVYGENCMKINQLSFDHCTQDSGSITLVCSPSTTPSTTPTTTPSPSPTTIPPPPVDGTTTTSSASTTSSTSTSTKPSTTTTLLSTTTTIIPLPSYEVTITPSSASILPQETVQFSAVTTRDGEIVEGTYQWYIDSTMGSSIDEQGLFKAGIFTETVTVSVLDKANRDITATATVIVSPLWSMAYDEMWGANKNERLYPLRVFRDEVLTENAVGRDYIFMLYNNSLEILILLLQDPSLTNETKKVIDELLPGIQPIIEGKNMTISKQAGSDIYNLLSRFETKASPGLKRTIKQVRNDIREGRIFEQLKIQRVE